MRPTIRLLGLPILVAVACSDAADGTSDAAPGPDDGWAGDVVVVSNEDLTNAPALRLEEAVRIGSLDGPEETQHFRVVDMAFVGDELWVLDAGDEEVRVYDGSGAYLRTVGRSGDGPGEFRYPRYMDRHADTIVVVDGQRVTFFDRSGEPLGTTQARVETEYGGSSGVRSSGRHWIRIISNRFGSGELNVLFRETTRVFASGGSPEELGSEVLSFPNEPVMLAGELGFALRPFYSATPLVSVGSDGRLYYSPGETYRIDIVDAGTGAPVRRIVGDASPIPVTDAMVQRAWAQDEERIADPRPGSETEMYAEIARMRLDLPVPEARPVVGRLVPATDGGLLVERDDLDPDPLESGDPTFWDVYEPDGAFVGRFTAGPEIRVMGYHEERILALERDEMDVQYVVVYRLARP